MKGTKSRLKRKKLSEVKTLNAVQNFDLTELQRE